ncbi:hypothetical protein MSAN_01107600 [Mycena sanguinolenta]|uniref:Uncharacterized protein n=1 Tax=Mycena sanguinolenta TaxID=230812 RepID=A0A8H6YT94_9AGAR|nr:hypothetical protein MSAN_01107600 [Mycena sanguinolenta]
MHVDTSPSHLALRVCCALEIKDDPTMVDYGTTYNLQGWVCPSNRLGHTVAYMFLDLVRRHGGMPMQVTTDCGSETTILFGIINTLCVHNVPVERSWYRLQLDFGDTAVLKFIEGEANDWYNKNNPDNTVLDDALTFRNGLKMRLQRDKPGLSGMSREVAFTLPEKWGGRNCLLPISMDQVRKMKADLGGAALLEFTGVEFAQRAQVVLDSLQPIKLSLENGCAALNSSVTIGVVVNVCIGSEVILDG